MTGASDDQLIAEGVAARYTGGIQALSDASLRVRVGEIVAIVGANGAGKTTLMRALCALLGAERGQVTAGTILFEATNVLDSKPADLVRRGLVSVPEGRRCFKSLSVEDNLVTGAAACRSSNAGMRRDLDQVYALFPHLATKRALLAGKISGGEQQMTAIGRALMARPKLLVLDEPSMGLAPLVVRGIFDSLSELSRSSRLSILFAEQNAVLAQQYAHRTVALTLGISSELDNASNAELERSYFGMSDG